MITDVLVLLVTVYLAFRGMAKGILGTLIGPTAFVVASVISVIYYSSTQNIPITLGIAIIGPFVLSFLFHLLIGVLGKALGGDGKPSALSSLLGGTMNVMWGFILVLPVVLVIGLLPPIAPGVDIITQDVSASRTFGVMKPMLDKVINPPANSQADGAAPKSDASEAIRQLAEDPQMKKLFGDPQIQKAVEEKNYGALMQNPKMLEAAQDPAFIKKVLSFYSSYSSQLPTTGDQNSKSKQ